MRLSFLWRSGVAAGAIGALLVAPAAASDSARSGLPKTSVYVVQGVPRVPVDIAIDGKAVQQGVRAKSVLGPFDLSDGEHRVTFSATRWTVSSVLNVSHRSSDVVLHWPADVAKKPVVTVYGNDLAPVPAGKGRLTIAHTAVVPPADVRVDKKVLFANIANGEFVSAEVPGGTFSVDLVPTGQTTNPFLGPLDLPVKPGVLTRVFAIGEPKNGSMGVVVQALPLAGKGSPMPTQVDAGAAGLVASGAPSRAGQETHLATPLTVGGVLVVVAGLVAWASLRRPAR